MKPVTRILLGYAALAMAAGLAVTFSRGGWAAAAVGVLAVLVGFARPPKSPDSGVAAAAGSARRRAVFCKDLFGEVNSSTSACGRHGEHRPGRAGIARGDMWTCGGADVAGPFLVGRRARRITIIVSANTARRRSRLQPDRAHNDYLNLLADWGTVGGIIVLAGMAAFAAGLWETRNHVRRAERDLGGRRHKQPLCLFPRRVRRPARAGGPFRLWISTCTFPPTRFWA